MRLLLATRSAHKAAEIGRILEDVPRLELLDLHSAGIPQDPFEEGIEAFQTFEENAQAKARYFRQLTGLATVADDSGLEVVALGGDPGVRSRRFAPDGTAAGLERDLANNRHLLLQLAGRPPEERAARYVCVAVLVREGGEVRTFRGVSEGRILTSPRGEGGFGYDPLFLDEELGRTYAELLPAEKNLRSHRGQAFRALSAYLKSAMPNTPSEIGPTEDGQALRIRWEDGHVSVYEPRLIRLRCPCAGCVDEMTGLRTLAPDTVADGVYPIAIHHVGRYALSFDWSDGHRTGVYPFEYLRQLCACEACTDGPSRRALQVL